MEGRGSGAERVSTESGPLKWSLATYGDSCPWPIMVTEWTPLATSDRVPNAEQVRTRRNRLTTRGRARRGLWHSKPSRSSVTRSDFLTVNGCFHTILGTPNQSHISPSILVYEDRHENRCRRGWVGRSRRREGLPLEGGKPLGASGGQTSTRILTPLRPENTNTGRDFSSSLLLSSLELSDTQLCALNTSPPRKQVQTRLGGKKPSSGGSSGGGKGSGGGKDHAVNLNGADFEKKVWLSQNQIRLDVFGLAVARLY